ncbi:unnamed protein product [Thlaspi arvense]|uniref:Retrovirus-related Pol polyprotein from transposon TNT 1-94-like beta-barrel domain-containing protein n=1 Tax=Thlaspi arvense TaxID=13288 RepID=A0AAU9RXC4_THLAR|nr:unnamed protein product [Thlaspi arvense]
MSYECVAPLIDEYMDLENMSLAEFHEFFATFGSLPGRGLALMLKDTFDSPKWGQISSDVRNKNNRNQEEAKKNQYREVEAEYEMLSLTIGDFVYDEDMWMVYTTTSNHMTPYVKFFTTLDRTHRARVRFADGSITMTEGRGDVRIMTKEGKTKTIKDVLYVPAINRNVLSVYHLTSIGYSVIMEGNKRFKFTIKDQNGKLFGETNLNDKGYFYLRFQVIEGNLTS